MRREGGLSAGVALDTTLFVDLARRRPNAISKLEELQSRREAKVIPAPVAYEILRGVLGARSQTQAGLIRRWLVGFQAAPLDLVAAERAAEVQIELTKLGRIKGVVDVLTAGIAIAGDYSLVTRDTDFAEIAEAPGLVIESY